MRILVSLLFLLSNTAWTLAQEETQYKTIVAPILKAQCFKCHGKPDNVEGDFDLGEIASSKELAANAELLEQLIEVIDTRSMPPEEENGLTEIEREQVLNVLRQILKESFSTLNDFPQSPIRRMNRFQYGNSVEDLFELDRVVFPLPERMMRAYGYYKPSTGKMPDVVKVGSRPLGKSQMIQPRLGGVSPFPQDLRAEHGFDNRGDHLSMSPMLMEAYLKLSRSIVESPDFNSKSVGIWGRFFASPKDESKTNEQVSVRLRWFLTRAFRRPVNEEVLSRYCELVIHQIENGTEFEPAMKMAASAAIASPRFLYIFDGVTQSKVAEKVDDFELASRLSFFLWGSIPDEELLELASTKSLSEAIKPQVARMLDDEKSKRFCDSFAPQWLQLERIISAVPDRQKFPEFYFAKFRVSMHMMLEPLLIFETVLIENRSIRDLIDSDFTYRSEMLNAWYEQGKPVKAKPAMIPFSRMKLDDRRFGGVVTNAAVMTMTSSPTRTQPITRGAWVLTAIFNSPPEPPPADVPALPEPEDESISELTIRERFAAHRKQATCAGCHVKIDPLGFALENFGPTGLWRDRYENGREVDSAGSLFREHEFRSIVQFKDAILSEDEKFARAFSKHLLAFALAREISPADAGSLEQIVSASKSNNFRMRDLISQVALSDSFRTKYNPAVDMNHADTAEPKGR